MSKTNAIPEEFWDRVEGRFGSYMEGRKFPMEIATTFNFILFDEFKQLKNFEEGILDLKPTFVGEYVVDPENPEQTRVYCHQGTEACSPIPIEAGVIGRAVRTGEDQYVADVVQDPLHVGCDPDMQGTEVVLIAWSDPYSAGSFEGCSVPLGVLDIDLNVKDAFSKVDVSKLRTIWDKYAKLIFPGQASFQPKGELFVRPPARNLKIQDLAFNSQGELSYLKVNGYDVSLVGFSAEGQHLVGWCEAICQLPVGEYDVSFVVVLDRKDESYPEAGPCAYIDDREIVLGLPEPGSRSQEKARQFLLHQVYHEIGHILFGEDESQANSFADKRAGSPWS